MEAFKLDRLALLIKDPPPASLATLPKSYWVEAGVAFFLPPTSWMHEINDCVNLFKVGVKSVQNFSLFH